MLHLALNYFIFNVLLYFQVRKLSTFSRELTEDASESKSTLKSDGGQPETTVTTSSTLNPSDKEFRGSLFFANVVEKQTEKANNVTFGLKLFHF